MRDRPFIVFEGNDGTNKWKFAALQNDRVTFGGVKYKDGKGTDGAALPQGGIH